MRFHATIEERPGAKRPGIWTGFALPEALVAELGPTRTDGRPRKRIPVRGEFAGVPFRGSVYLRPGGEWEFITGLELRGRAGVGIGDTVDVEMAEDVEHRSIAPPPDLAAALSKSPGMRERWDARPWSHQREFLIWVDDTKRPQTREKRIGQVVEALEKDAGLYREGRNT